MGVHGLWQLLAPVGRRVSNEHVRNKVLAVDVSIWLTQLVKAMRDAEGARVRNAHLIGVFRRCIKLLFLSVKPVLVFDGATPSIKRRTVAARRAQREKHEAKLRRLAEKILVNRIKKKAVGDALLRKNGHHETQSSAKDSTAATNEHHIEPDASENDDDEIQPFYPDAPPSNASRKKFGVSDTTSRQLGTENPVQKSAEAVDEAEHSMQNSDSDSEQIMLPNDLQDLDDAALVGLPAHLQSKVFKQIKHEQRLRHRENMLQQRDNPTEFSKTQIEGFLRHTALNRKISNVRNVINDNSGVRNRIASDSRREFVFEEFKEPNQEEFDLNSDSDEDILHPSFAKKRSVMSATDILSQIRSAKEHNDESSTLRSATAVEKRKRERTSASGVGWASRVLSGNGGLELSRMAAGTEAYKQIPRTPSEEGDEVVEKDFEWKDQDDIQVDESGHQALEPTPGEEKDSDSDEIEWEDGAAKSDSENSSISLRITNPSDERAGKVRDISKEKSCVSSVAKESNDVSASEDVIRNIHESDPQRHASELKKKESHNVEQTNRNPPEIRDEEQQVLAKSKDATFVDVNLKTNSEPSGTQNDVRPAVSSISTRTLSADKETLRLKRNETLAPISRTQVLNTALGEAIRTQSSSMVNSDTVVIRKAPLQSDGDKSQSPSIVPRTDSSGPSKRLTENSNTRRKSRAVDEEDSDIQMAIALSLKENVSTVLKPYDKNRLPAPEDERNRDRNDSVQREKDEALTGERQKAGSDIQDNSNEIARITHHDMSAKDADDDGVAPEGTFYGTEVVSEGQNREGEMTLMEMERLYADLDTEAQQFKKQRDSHVSAAETISDEMYAETRDLLKLLGIPYLEAPMEAEAQCAFLNTAKIVDGVITEDSDAFLFGAEVVYRQLFADGRFAEIYEAQDIRSNLGLHRDHLIRLAHLLGSDYTPGVRGVGIVNAMEIMEAFPGEQGLSEFLEWTKKVTVLDKEPEESVMTGTSAEAVQRRFCWKHRNMKRNWVIREGFPNPAVSEAYLKPTIDNNKEPFKWRGINFDGLARFCWEKFGWEQNTFENAVSPLRKELIKRRGPQQTRIPEFFKPHRFAKIRSKRLQQAVKGITGEEVEEIMASTVPRIKRRKTNAMMYNATIDLSPEEEEQVLQALEETEARTNGGGRRARLNR